MHKGTVTLPRDFFVRERNQLYANWKFAFFRELFQNSVDAGAVTIAVSIVDDGERCIVSFDDDGRGMDLDTFEKVYFRLGETSKGVADDDGAYGRVGGFGRARILTHFSMPSYEIRTGKLRVRGEGAEFEIETRDEDSIGCRMTIHVDATADTMLLQLRNYLSCSQIACHVTVNGEQWTAWALKRQLVSNLTLDGQVFASVYVSDTGIINRALIRVKGTTMFTERIKTPKQVVIEVEPDFSRMALTGNRDGFHETFAAEVRVWLNSISANPTSALRKRKNPIIQITSRDGAYVTVNSSLDELPVRSDEIEGDVYFISELSPDASKKLFEQFAPDTTRMETIFRCWIIACSEIIPHVLKLEHRPAITWACGWYFGEELAKFVMIGDVAVFCLNPIDAEGKPRYSPNPNSVRQLFATAKHEVVHAFHLDHDENFSSLLSALDGIQIIAPDTIKNRAEGQLLENKLNADVSIHINPRSMKVLQVMHAQGPISRRDCINTIQKIENDLGMTAGAHHWSHPLFSKLKQNGLLATTGEARPTSGSSKSEVYCVTELGLRVLRTAEEQNDLTESVLENTFNLQ